MPTVHLGQTPQQFSRNPQPHLKRSTAEGVILITLHVQMAECQLAVEGDMKLYCSGKHSLHQAASEEDR